MTKPPGKLLLVAAILCGATLAQAAEPTGPSSITSAAPAVPRAGSPVRLTVQPAPPVVTRTTPVPRKPARRPPARTRGKVLYLTFDDGPQQVWTPTVLRILARHRAKATFFVVGREAAAHPDLIAAIWQQGHAIGNHTWDHPRLTKVGTGELRRQITTGVRSRCFRPPFRDTNAQVARVAAGYGQREVLWDVDTRDWSKPGAARIEKAIVRGARREAIVLLHDGGGDRSQTATALDRALTRLTRAGYTYEALPC